MTNKTQSLAQLEAALAAPVEPVAYAVMSKKGGVHKMAITRESAERKAAHWQTEWPNNGCQVVELFRAPPATAPEVGKRVISDAEIDAIARPHSIETETGIEFTERELIDFARAIIAKSQAAT